MLDDSDVDEIIAYLTRLKTDINSDLIPALNRGDPEGGYWSCIQLIFTNIEFLSAFFSNKNTPATTVEFIKKYFKKIHPILGFLEYCIPFVVMGQYINEK